MPCTSRLDDRVHGRWVVRQIDGVGHRKEHETRLLAEAFQFELPHPIHWRCQTHAPSVRQTRAPPSLRI